MQRLPPTRCYRRTRRELRLGLIDPAVGDRFLLWAIASGSAFLLGACLMVFPLDGQQLTGNLVPSLLTMVVSIVTGVSIYLAFCLRAPTSPGCSAGPPSGVGRPVPAPRAVAQAASPSSSGKRARSTSASTRQASVTVKIPTSLPRRVTSAEPRWRNTICSSTSSRRSLRSMT
jgi:hypothetical protein